MVSFAPQRFSECRPAESAWLPIPVIDTSPSIRCRQIIAIEHVAGRVLHRLPGLHGACSRDGKSKTFPSLIQTSKLSMTSKQAWKASLQVSAILLCGLSTEPSHALSESRTFFSKTIYDERLKLCIVAGTGCGKIAADTWCRHAGYKGAMSYRSVSSSSQTERAQLVGYGELCAEDACNGFQFVKCRRDVQP